MKITFSNLMKILTSVLMSATLMSNSASAQNKPLAQERMEVIDALYRFAKGMDDDDAQMLQSAFAKDAVADFTPAAKRLGIQFPLLSGRDNIVSALGPFAAGLTTSHSVSNPRVVIKGRTATLHALMEAQHLPVNDRNRNILMKNRYVVELTKEGSQWTIRQMTIDNIWYSGDIKVINGQ